MKEIRRSTRNLNGKCGNKVLIYHWKKLVCYMNMSAKIVEDFEQH